MSSFYAVIIAMLVEERWAVSVNSNQLSIKNGLMFLAYSRHVVLFEYFTGCPNYTFHICNNLYHSLNNFSAYAGVSIAIITKTLVMATTFSHPSPTQKKFKKF